MELVDEIKKLAHPILPELLEKVFNINYLLSINKSKNADYQLGYVQGAMDVITMLKTDDFEAN